MNQLPSIIVLLVLYLLVFPSISSAAIQLIYPAEKSWVYRSDYIILKTNDSSITGIKLTVNGTDTEVMQIDSPGYRRVFQDIFIVQPVWDKGKNILLVEGFSKDRKVQTLATEIFFNPLGDRSLVPAEFKPNSLHTPDTEKICAPCHDMLPGSAKTAANLSGQGPCASCHNKLAKVKYPHEPVAAFTCGYCHNKTGTPAHGLTRRDTALCYDCHADKAEYISKSAFPHGPVAGGMCEICHDAHGTDFPAFMRRPINEVCLACHEKIAKSKHVLGTSGREGHPLSGSEDKSPKRKGKPFACVSCHDPHGGKVRYFFVSGSAERMTLCQFCHVK